MINNLIKLANFLDRNGFKKESDYLDDMIRKIAVPPMEAIFTLPSTRVKFEDEEGEDLDEPVWESDEPIKDPTYISGYAPRDWYGSLEALGTSVILIPFEEDALDESDIMALSVIFGVEAYDYEGLKQETNSFSLDTSGSKFGDRDLLKNNFPSLWAEISKVLNEKGLREENVVYLLYNEDHPPPRGLFVPEKSPRYLGHDIGHIEVDFGEDPKLTYEIYSFLYELSGLYKAEDGSALREELSDEYDEQYYSEEAVQHIISSVFDVFSGDPSDDAYDIISYALAGTLEAAVPDDIYYEGQDYSLQKGSKARAEKITEDFLSNYEMIIKEKQDGPLSEFKGHVMLYDI